MAKDLNNVLGLIDQIEDAVTAKKAVGELLGKEQELSEILSVALNANPVEMLKGLRAATYHETHQDEQTPQLRAVNLLAGIVKFLRFIECDEGLQQMLDDAGISVSINPGREFVEQAVEPTDISYLEKQCGTDALPYNDIKTTKDLAFYAWSESIERRLNICEQMKIRKATKKTVVKELEVQPQEYSRLFQITGLAVEDTDKSASKVFEHQAQISSSLSNFNIGLKAISRKAGISQKRS